MTNHIFDPHRNPLEDMRDALEQARSEGKHVLMELGGDWCIWCKRLHDFIENNPILKQLRDDHYVVVKVYIDQEEPVNLDFITRLPNFTGVPHLFIYTRHGNLLCSLDTELLESGETYDYTAVHDFLKRWSDLNLSPFKTLDDQRAKRLFDHYFNPSHEGPTLSA